ncbi:transcription factor GLABRA 3-like [Salvia hispanica]|uniref:transcription factor GLABRA 3-like n=1 Tax=Salvia hispanica TaxID=49212 RepID=UPI00200913A9|nr:transcription factor GLABRA 3-like [Salvia hispanica]XP_047970506.1 transcription factor GLABRA 3-like [Salvia hispanica]
MATGNQNQKEMPQNLRTHLALAVQSFQWSYAIFWSVSCIQPGMLEWCEGYYNGDIKTRKTVQVAEVDMDQLGLQRSDQLRELYVSLSLGDTKPQAKRPTTALSPEDLTDAEWYFLVCMSFVFNANQGLPGRTLAANQMIWLCNAHRADTKVFSRSLLAKSASIKTIVCFPHSGGVVELGTTELVPEDPSLIRHISSFLKSPSVAVPLIPNLVFDSSSCNPNDLNLERLDHGHMLEDGLDRLMDDPYMEICSPYNSSDDFANNLLRDESNLVEGVGGEASKLQSWPVMEDAVSNCLNNSVDSSDCVSQTEGEPETVIPHSDGNKEKKSCMQECNQKTSSEGQGHDVHYHSVLSYLLKSSHQLILGPYIRNGSTESSFVCWKKVGVPGPQRGTTPQKLLKKVLFEVARLHQSCRVESDKHHICPKSDEADRNHVLSERKRREKINERFMILGSLVPSGGKGDKVSVLDHTIEHLRELERRVEELESYKEAMERGSTTHSKSQDAIERTSDNYRDDNNSKKPAMNKRKAGHRDKTGPRLRDSSPTDNITISVSNKVVLIEMRCLFKEHVLFEVMETLSKIHLETQTIQSSTNDGTLSITVNAKCEGLKSPSAVEIKEALQKIIRKC